MRETVLRNNAHEEVVLVRRSARARALRFVVYPGGTCVAIVPRSTHVSIVARAIETHRAWILKHIERLRPVSVLQMRGKKRELLRYRGSALALAEGLLTHFNQGYGYAYRKVTIRNQKTRWGSCSKNGNLSFNYKIALLPRPLAEYVVVHELCHLKEHNHSARFWALVAQTIPDWKERRTQLKSGRY